MGPSPVPKPANADVIVIGAGVTGLGAAQKVKAAGYSVIVLEAMNRIGGRCYCDNTTFSVPVDIGAEWFHQVLSANPLIGIAIDRSKTDPNVAKPVPDIFPRLILDGSTQVDALDPSGHPDVEAAFNLATAMNVEINAAGALAGNVHPDVSCAAATNSHVGEKWYGFGSAASGVGRTGTALKNSSSLDYYNFSLLSPAPVTVPIGDDWLIRTGMGNFIATFARGLDIRLSSPVTKVLYTRQGVTVTAGEKAYTAKAAIVTASVGVLRSNKIAFEPRLPALHRNALAHMKMGYADKFWMQFKAGAPLHLPNPGYNVFCTPLLDLADLPIFQMNLWKSNAALCLVDSAVAEEYEALGTQGAVKKQILPIMEGMFPGITPYYTGTAVSSNWVTNEWTRGAYSYAEPGWAHARTDLLTPIAGTLYFAGEANSAQSHGSLGGGYSSGLQQAKAVIATLQVLPKHA